MDTREAAAAAEGLLAHLHGGQVLITSRLTQWSASVEPLELDVLEPQDATLFLLSVLREAGASSPATQPTPLN